MILNLAGIPITPIGNSSVYFSGSLDGNYHVIQNVVINTPTADYVGLFGSVGDLFIPSLICNLGVIDVNIRGNMYVGGLIGAFFNGSVINCYSMGSVRGEFYSGGLIGVITAVSNHGMINNCYSTCHVTGRAYLGGLAGESALFDIINSYAKGSVYSFNSSECYSGGLVGLNSWSIANCYSTGSVSSDSMGYIGGLIGFNNYGTISSCFWDKQTSGMFGSDGGTGKTTAEMKTLSTFTSAGWDFTTIWDICEVTNYPRLVWQIPEADWLCPNGVNHEDMDCYVERWLENDCNSSNDYCDGVDLDTSGTVDLAD